MARTARHTHPAGLALVALSALLAAGVQLGCDDDGGDPASGGHTTSSSHGGSGGAPAGPERTCYSASVGWCWEYPPEIPSQQASFDCIGDEPLGGGSPHYSDSETCNSHFGEPHLYGTCVKDVPDIGEVSYYYYYNVSDCQFRENSCTTEDGTWTDGPLCQGGAGGGGGAGGSG